MELAEAKETFEACGDKTSNYRRYYEDTYGRQTTLSDDDIIMMVCNADDDMDPPRWAETMFVKEQAKVSA